ncbi:hypothetical protein GGS20DRAFT_586231 [Poronia punctata]|nr:hypothetical protein GGS20DRAFT_586231 [Poronia punctata]
MQLQASPITLDLSQERPTKSRRARPPNISITQHESSTSLRSERATKRESKSALRNLFGRTKAGKTGADNGESSRVTSRPAGIRASLADLGNWPSRLHSSRSEIALNSSVPGDSRPSALDSRVVRSPTDRSHPVAPATGRVISAPWDPPPLFRVYPQAVKHATLPACNVSAETLARLSDAKRNRSSQGATGSELKNDAARRFQRISAFRNVWECTSKIFVLVTSGHLLQYAAEGSFDRVPEKVLQLTRTSAAYASDLIPGRHWVLHVASTIDSDGNASVDPKPVRSKRSTREKRQVPNMLLIFETPDSMDDWLAVLRKEIEALGGKKKLSETESSEPGDPAVALQAHASQEGHDTIIEEDPDRLSDIVTRDFSYTQANALNDPNDSIASARPFSAYTIDDGSTTASVVSIDGQRLDNLRDSSSSSHRFSYMSSGQRTMVTSACSSPTSSPTRMSFCSQGEDSHTLSSVPEVRLRPNAAAIANRRQSMQALFTPFETPIEHRPQPSGGYVSALNKDGDESSGSNVTNLKRLSLNTSSTGGLAYLHQSLENERGARAGRKARPTALMTSRPLSIVIDQPSPLSPCPPSPSSRSGEPSLSLSLDSSMRTGRDVSPDKGASRRAPSPRPCSETIPTWPDPHQATEEEPGKRVVEFGIDVEPDVGDSSRINDIIRRPATSLDSYVDRRRLSGASASESIHHRRLTFLHESPPMHNRPRTSDNDNRSIPSPRSSVQQPSPRLLAIDSQSKFMTPRRSPTQVVEGPPPAPPPSYALPPIPSSRRNTKA